MKKIVIFAVVMIIAGSMQGAQHAAITTAGSSNSISFLQANGLTQYQKYLSVLAQVNRVINAIEQAENSSPANYSIAVQAVKTEAQALAQATQQQ